MNHDTEFRAGLEKVKAAKSFAGGHKNEELRDDEGHAMAVQRDLVDLALLDFARSEVELFGDHFGLRSLKRLEMNRQSRSPTRHRCPGCSYNHCVDCPSMRVDRRRRPDLLGPSSQ
jgi:hypothetical protein